MIQILLHSSKTMRVPEAGPRPNGVPQLIDSAKKLAGQYGQLSTARLVKLMGISETKAAAVHGMYTSWSVDPKMQTPAIDAFVGDIYSGLQVQQWTQDDRTFAHKHLLILSGLYGGLRACDGIMPYRLEMAYKLSDGGSLYEFWNDSIAKLLPKRTDHIINLSAVEYTKALLPHTNLPVIRPKFLTKSAKTKRPEFVTVHAKIARGACAGWLVRHRVSDIVQLQNFNDLGYRYDITLSTDAEPVFVCETFGGIGLSVRLT